MAIPGISFTKVNGSARPIGSGTNKALVVGPANGVGTTVKDTTIYTFTNANSVAGTIGHGSAQEAAELILANAPGGYSSVDVVVSSGSISPEVTEVSAASPTIDITNDGNARSTYDFLIEVTKAGARGAAKFKYSADGGNTYSPDILVPSNGQYTFTNTGVSCSFAASTHAVGNKSRYTIKGPRMNTTDLSKCITTLSTSNDNYTLILVADENDDQVSGSALFTAMDGHLTTLANSYFKFTQAVVNVGGESKLFNRTFTETAGTHTQSDVNTAMASAAVTAGNGIMACAEKVNTYLAIPFVGYSRPRKPFSWIVAAAAHGVGKDFSENIAAEPLPRCETPSYDDFMDGTVYHDDRIVAPRTFTGEAGVFVNQSLNKYTVGGESFDLWYKVRLTNRAAEVVKTAIRPFLNRNVRVLLDGTGRINPSDAVPIEAAVNKALRAALIDPVNNQGTRGYCSGFDFTIDRETNVLSTSTLTCRTRIVPFANISQIDVTISLEDSLEVVPVS
jgi:hypothetical protein